MPLFTPLLFVPIILAWSLPNFLFKHLTKYLDNSSIIVMYHLVYHLFVFPFIIYTLFNNKTGYKNFMNNTKSLPTNIKIYIFLIVALGLLSQYCYFRLLRQYDVTTVLPIIRGSSAVIVLTLGYFIFKENVNRLKVIGAMIVLLGIYLITQS
jgi:drug/metabolite transporter (DMT)-like permease